MSVCLFAVRGGVVVLSLWLLVGRLAGAAIVPPGNGALPPLHVKHGYGLKGLVLWVAADSGITSDAQGQVTTLVDCTGNFTLATSGGTPGPTLVPNILNGHPVLRFNGTQSLYSPYNFGNTLDHAMTFVIVASTHGAADEEFSLYLGKNAESGCNRALAIYKGKDLLDGQWVGCQGEPALKDAFLMTGASLSPLRTQATFYRNDKRVMTSGLVPASTAPFGEVSDGVTLGAAPGQLYGWNGDIAEALVFDRQLTPVEMRTLWSALSAKYGLQPGMATTTPASAHPNALP